MSAYRPRVGDVVSIEGVVKELDIDEPRWVRIRPTGSLTLVSRPAPPLPTEPGTTGTATVRGVPGMRVMLHDDDNYGARNHWGTPVPVCGYYGHADSDISDFTPDPQTSGAAGHLEDRPGAATDTDAIVALSPDEARHIAALLRREYPLDAAPDDQECQRFDALADRIIGAIPVGAA